MRIAILGGTFDPVHEGHLRAARIVSETFVVDEVHFIPAFLPPHKTSSRITSAFHRTAMLALAIAPYEPFRLSTIEVDRLERRYTVDTLELMHDRYPDSQFLFITGTDLYAEIEDWKDCDRLFDLTSFAVVNRPGSPMREDIRSFDVVNRGARQTLDAAAPGVYYLPELEETVSSTALRTGIAGGADPGNRVPAAVETYIRRHHLYA